MTRASGTQAADKNWAGPFHLEQDEGGHFYALAWCAALAPGEPPVDVRLTLYFTPAPNFSRFSLFAHDYKGGCWLYHRGPEHSPTIDAVLLNAWVTLGVPAYAWHLFPVPPSQHAFLEPIHATGYRGARYELCRALHGIRVTSWSAKELASPALILPPAGGFQLVDAFAASDENSELLAAAVAEEAPE